MQRNYWVVRLGEANKYADVCHRRSLIGVGWDAPGLDLSKYAHLDQREFAEKVGKQLGKVIKGATEKYLLGSARQLYKFAVLMKPGDFVMSPADSGGLKYFGIIRGGYQYVSGDEELPYPHRREVEWLTTVDKSVFSEDLRNSSGSVMTVFNLSPHAEELERLISGRTTPFTGTDTESLKDFGMESHLEDFIVENWNRITAFKGFEIMKEDGEVVGQQYSTNIGQIDILARSKDKKTWLVIELKKGKTGDQVVGQTLRYIGWVKKNEAEKDHRVRGLIIAGDRDEKLAYALETVENIGFMTYAVSFELQKVR